MRYQLAWDHELCRAVVGVFVRLRLIALIQEAAVIERILRHLGLPTETPAARPARGPPLLAGVPDAAGWDDDASVFEACS